MRGEASVSKQRKNMYVFREIVIFSKREYKLMDNKSPKPGLEFILVLLLHNTFRS
jgi:hypothetical protein